MSFLARMVVALAVLCLTRPAEAAEQWTVLQEKSQVGFLVHSTMNTFHGKAQAVFGGFEQDQSLAKGKIGADIVKLTTNNPERDHHMYLMFEEAKYHQIYSIPTIILRHLFYHQKLNAIYSEYTHWNYTDICRICTFR